MTNHTPMLLIANSSGTVVGAHPPVPTQTVATRVGPVGRLARLARGNLVMLGAAALTAAFVAYISTFDEEQVNEAIQDWRRASKLLVNDDGSFVQAISAVIDSNLPATAWTAEDREAFNTYVQQYRNEIAAVASALDINAGELEKLRGVFHDTVTTMSQYLTPLLVLAVILIALQYGPPPIAAFARVTSAGIGSATVMVVGMLRAQLVTSLAAFGNVYTAGKAGTFTLESRPGHADPKGKDPDLKDIVIDWVKDDSFYRSGT